MTEPSAFPLSWPDGMPRTRNPKRSPFGDRTLEAALSVLDGELRRMKASHVLRSSNLPLRRDGLPYSTAVPGRDHGFAVYFRRRDQAHVIACDTYNNIRDNVYAIAKTIENLRAIERYGSASLADQAFSAFRALPSAGDAGPKVRHWREILGVPADLDREGQLLLAEVRYKRAVRDAHPDRGGDTDTMEELNGAIARAREELR